MYFFRNQYVLSRATAQMRNSLVKNWGWGRGCTNTGLGLYKIKTYMYLLKKHQVDSRATNQIRNSSMIPYVARYVIICGHVCYHTYIYIYIYMYIHMYCIWPCGTYEAYAGILPIEQSRSSCNQNCTPRYEHCFEWSRGLCLERSLLCRWGP